jgi:hypothetical protein
MEDVVTDTSESETSDADSVGLAGFSLLCVSTIKRIKQYTVKPTLDTTSIKQRRKLQKHGKKKNNKDEFGNILLKHVFTSL